MEAIDTAHLIAVMLMTFVGVWALFKLTETEDDK